MKIDKRSASKIDVYVKPKAFLKLRIKNLGNYNQSDILGFQVYSDTSFSASRNFSWPDAVEFFPFEVELNAERYNTLKYYYKKNGITVNKDTSFFAKSYEVKTITLDY